LVFQAVVTGNYCVASTQESWTVNIVPALLSVGTVTTIRDVIVHTSPTGTTSEDGDVARISPKLCNVLLNPAQSHHLVFQAVVTGNYCVASTQEAYMTVAIAIRLHSYQNVIIWLRLNRLTYFDVHGSVHHNTNRIEITNKIQPCSSIYYYNVS
jgi:hypothetical protein